MVFSRGNIRHAKEATGWTGRGELSLNFLKIGANPVIEIPLAVKFENMHLNQCYQILPDSKVITEFDAGWSNVVDVDDLNDRLQDIYNEIRDILATNPGDTAALQDKVDELNGIKAEYQNSGLTPAYIAQQTGGIDGATDATVCYINSSGSSGARLATGGSCSAEDVGTALNGAEGTAKTKICHTTLRGISPWTITFEDTEKDYLNNIKDGQLAHYQLGTLYKAFNSNAYTEYAIPGGSRKTGKYGYADIVNLTSREIFEIKSEGGEYTGSLELQNYIDKGNLYCKPTSGDWIRGAMFPIIPPQPWARDPEKLLVVKGSNGGVVVYGFIKNPTPKENPITVPAPSLEQVKQIIKLMSLATSYTAAENIARLRLKNMPDDVKWKILLGGATAIVAGVAVSSTGAGAPAGVTAAIIGAILVDVSFEQLNNSNYGGG